MAKLVKESYTSYTLNTNEPIPIKVYRIPLSEDAYNYVKDTLYHVHDDKDIHYNIFSVFTFPILKGCRVHKTYTYSEFVTYVLKDIGISMPLPCYRYKPEDLIYLLKDYFYYEGDIRDILSSDNIDDNFFNPPTWELRKECMRVLHTVSKRSLYFKK